MNKIKINQDAAALIFIKSQLIDSDDNKFIDHYIAQTLCLNDNSMQNANCQCESCNFLKNKLHPDFIGLNEETLSGTENNKITIEYVRKILDFTAIPPTISKVKIIYIELELLNHNCANALLKILEEPPSYVKFIMSTFNLSTVLPTIRSRCSFYKLQNLTSYNSNTRRISNLSTLQSNAFIAMLLKPSVSNIFMFVKDMYKVVEIKFILQFFYRWLQDLILISHNASPYYFIDFIEQMLPLVKKIDSLENIFFLSDDIVLLFTWESHSLNFQFQLENILFQYQKLFIL